MSYTKLNYQDVEAHHDALHVLREPLECEQMGFSILECDPGWVGPEHNHVGHDPDSIYANDHEEVYFLVEGEATVDIEGETVTLEPGDAVRLEPETTRQIRNGDTESTFVLAGAP
jgi:quercetin dioxygenase-like cupin family protein